MLADKSILVTGSGGKLGRILRQCRADLPASPLWQVRRDAGPGDILWNIGAGDYSGPPLTGGVILHLAGGRGDPDANSALALTICRLAAEQGARHVLLASSSAVYAPDDTADCDEETTAPAPVNDYGRAKLGMEREVTAWAAAEANAPGITFLRIGNVFGSDNLIGGAVPGRQVLLTPVPGRAGGPVRSYIGPQSFALALGQLCLRGVEGQALPRLLNIGTAPPVTMAGLLEAAGLPWAYGAESPDVIARLVLNVRRMEGLVSLPADAATPARMAAEWRALGGGS